MLGFARQVFDTELSLLGAVADDKVAARLQHVTMQQADGGVSYGWRSVFGIGETAVLATEVHHEPELPEWPHQAEQGDQQILVGVQWDLADEDLTVVSWNGPHPH